MADDKDQLPEGTDKIVAGASRTDTTPAGDAAADPHAAANAAERMGIGTIVHGDFDEVADRTRQAIADGGFGVLTEIDVTATLKKKIDRDIERILILGACNPSLAKQALDADRSIGLLLPCNVVVRAGAEGTVVEALDPQVMVTLTGQAQLKPVADDAGARLDRALAALTA